jgi:hypothetical protein
MTLDKPQFQVEQFEVLYTGALQPPRVRLPSPESGVADLLLQQLAPFGVTLEYAGYNPSWNNLSQAYMELKFFDGYGVCRLWPNVLELRFQKTPLPSSSALRDQASQLLVRAVSALHSADQDVHLSTHSFTISLHGRLSGESTADFLRRFVKEPPAAFGSVADLGAKYTFKPDAEGRSSSLDLEPSASIQPDGLYVRLGVTFNADEVEISRAVPHAASCLETVLSQPDFPVEVRQ